MNKSTGLPISLSLNQNKKTSVTMNRLTLSHLIQTSQSQIQKFTGKIASGSMKNYVIKTKIEPGRQNNTSIRSHLTQFGQQKTFNRL